MKTIKSLVRYLAVVKGLFVVSAGIYLVSVVANQLSPLLLQRVIDMGLRKAGSSGFTAGNFQQQLLLYLLLVTVGTLLAYAGNSLLMVCATRTVEAIRNKAYDVLQRLPIAYFDDKPAGKIATRIVNDTETLRTQFYGTLVYLFTNAARVLFTYGVIFVLNPWLGLILLVLLPVFYAVQKLYQKLTDEPMKTYYEARSAVNVQVNEAMNGASLLQLYGQEEVTMEAFDETAQTLRAADNRILWGQSIASWPLTEFLRNLVVTLILTLVGYQFLAGHSSITPGRLFVYLTYMMTLFDEMGMLVRQAPNIQRSLETGRRVLELLEEDQEADCSEELVMTDGRVVFDKVSFAYEEGKPTLQDINLVAEKGETVALVGHTGSGKSSMMNLLYRFYDPQAGQIVIDGQEISKYSRESLRSHMGIVLQDPYLFTGTIASNVSMDTVGARDEDILAALEKVGAGPMIARLDKGIHEPVVEKGAAFSSGERQLIAFARTLFSNPKLLILDEATSHIDTETEEIIQRAMEVLKEGRTTFIIAHRLSTIQHADQILVLDKGRIAERGTHEELVAQGGLYAQMHQLQQKV